MDVITEFMNLGTMPPDGYGALLRGVFKSAQDPEPDWICLVYSREGKYEGCSFGRTLTSDPISMLKQVREQQLAVKQLLSGLLAAERDYAEQLE